MFRELKEFLTPLVAAAEEWLRDRRRSRPSPQFLAHPQADPLLTADEAAEYTRQHVKTILSDAREGLLATVRRADGGPVRVRLSDLNRYIDQQHRPATAGGKSKSIDEINWDV